MRVFCSWRWRIAAPTRTTVFVSTESSYNGDNKQWTVPLQLGVNQLVQVGGLVR